jgi:protein TonB
MSTTIRVLTLRSLASLLGLAVFATVGPPPARAQACGTEPEFTPYTAAPSLRNADDVVQALIREYPPELREEGIGGTVSVWFCITAQGRVQSTRIDASSGLDALDQAAMRVADVYDFAPAMNRTEPVTVWVSLPITFQVRRPGNT